MLLLAIPKQTSNISLYYWLFPNKQVISHAIIGYSQTNKYHLMLLLAIPKQTSNISCYYWLFPNKQVISHAIIGYS